MIIIVSVDFNLAIDPKILTKFTAAPDVVNKAFNLAISRALDKARTTLTRETVKQYYIGASDIRKTITAKTIATNGLKQGVLTSKGERLHLSKFKISPKSPSYRMNGRNYQAAVKRSGGLKSLAPNAFYIPSKKQAFRRIAPGGRGFQNLRVLMGPAIPQILKNEQTLDVATRETQNVFTERLSHEVQRLLFA